MSSVPFKSDCFVLNMMVSLLMLKMALNPFCDETLHIHCFSLLVVLFCRCVASSNRCLCRTRKALNTRKKHGGVTIKLISPSLLSRSPSSQFGSPVKSIDMGQKQCVGGVHGASLIKKHWRDFSGRMLQGRNRSTTLITYRMFLLASGSEFAKDQNYIMCVVDFKYSSGRPDPRKLQTKGCQAIIRGLFAC